MGQKYIPLDIANSNLLPFIGINNNENDPGIIVIEYPKQCLKCREGKKTQSPRFIDQFINFFKGT